MYLVTSKRLPAQPAYPLGPSQFAEEINVRYLFNAALGRVPINAVDGTPISTAIGNGLDPSPWQGGGLGFHGSGGGNGGWIGNVPPINYPFSLFAYGGSQAFGAGTGMVISYGVAGVGFCALQINSNFVDTNFWQGWANAAGDTTFGSSADQLVGRARLAVVAFRSASDFEIFVDGVSRGTGATNGPTLSSSFQLGVGSAVSKGFSTSTLGSAARVEMCGLALGEIPRAAQLEISANPWILFRPQQRRIYVNVLGGGGGFTAKNRRTLGYRVGSRSYY